MFRVIKKMFIALLSSIVDASNHIMCIKNVKFDQHLLTYILINTVTNFTTIHLRLIR